MVAARCVDSLMSAGRVGRYGGVFCLSVLRDATLRPFPAAGEGALSGGEGAREVGACGLRVQESFAHVKH